MLISFQILFSGNHVKPALLASLLDRLDLHHVQNALPARMHRIQVILCALIALLAQILPKAHLRLLNVLKLNKLAVQEEARWINCGCMCMFEKKNQKKNQNKKESFYSSLEQAHKEGFFGRQTDNSTI
jgi:hypothetical protein